jgi:AcrR family transcriptional regulator
MQPSAAETITDGSRAEILEAAARSFMERGYTETSIDDVARRLGATKGRIYHHFASKADLFAAIYRAGMDMDYAAIEPWRDTEAKADERLRSMAAAHCRQIIVSRPFQRVVWQGVQLLLRGATTPELRAELERLNDYRDAYEHIFRNLIGQARADGDLAVDNLSLSAALMFVTLNSPIFWYSQRPGETETHIDKLVSQVVNFAMQGLGCRGENSITPTPNPSPIGGGEFADGSAKSPSSLPGRGRGGGVSSAESLRKEDQ